MIFMIISTFRTNYILDWYHPKACPRKGHAISFGTVMLIIIAALILLYFAVGIPIMKFGLKKSGIEVIPFSFFWVSLPRLVWDGIKAIFSICPCCRKSSMEKYESIPD